MDPYPAPVDRQRPVVCALLAVPVVALSAVPGWQFEHWTWICLAAAAPVVVWGALPLHRGAARASRRGALGDDVPALLGTACAAAWSVAVLLRGPAGDPGWTQPFPPGAAGPPVRLDVAAGVTLALLVAAHLRTTGAPRPAGRAVVPLVLAVAAGLLGYRLGAGGDALPAATASLAVLLVAAPSAFRPPPGPVRAQRRVDTVLFTSRTLAGGPRRLHDVHTAAGTGRDEALRMAGALAEPSTHPAARAIARAAAELEVPAAGEFDERPGLGASGIVAELHPGDGEAPAGDLTTVSGPAGRRADGTAVTVVAHAVLLGHPDLLAEHDVQLPAELSTACAGIEEAGHTAVALAWDGQARAVLAVATDVGPDAVSAVAAARRAGTVPALLSARATVAAGSVAGRAGVDPGPDTVLAGVRPDGEADAVARLRGRGHVVAVVGASGRDDAALRAADVALPVASADGGPGHPDSAAAVRALRRARRRPTPAQWTVAAAVVYHAVALPVAASGLLDPLAAGLAGALATLACTARRR